MFLLNRYIKNHKGVTLVEILAAVVIFSIITILVAQLFVKGIETTASIQEEVVLRDEADLIISKFVKTLYSTQQSHIVRNSIDATGSYLEITNDLNKCQRDENGSWKLTTDCINTLEPLGFKTSGGVTKIVFNKNEEYSVLDNNVRILSSSRINGDPNVTDLYEIILSLEITTIHGGKKYSKTMEFKNNVQPITSFGGS